MQVYIRVKAAGKRRDVLEKKPYTLPEGLQTPEVLIAHIVRENVRIYNEKPVEAALLPYLTEDEYALGEDIGKISFGDKRSDKQQDADKAVANALQCYVDGIYRMLINDTEALPGADLVLREDDVITFVRLVMLAGRRW